MLLPRASAAGEKPRAIRSSWDNPGVLSPFFAVLSDARTA